MKTNKSYTKRIRATRTGKLIVRASGQNHFNAKQSGKQRLQKRRSISLTLSKHARRRFLPGKNLSLTPYHV